MVQSVHAGIHGHLKYNIVYDDGDREVNVERFRVIPTPANPHGLDPSTQTSIATALRRANYATGMSGKWYVRRARALT